MAIRLTESKLRQIIREEVSLLREFGDPPAEYMKVKVPLMLLAEPGGVVAVLARNLNKRSLPGEVVPVGAKVVIDRVVRGITTYHSYGLKNDYTDRADGSGTFRLADGIDPEDVFTATGEYVDAGGYDPFRNAAMA